MASSAEGWPRLCLNQCTLLARLFWKMEQMDLARSPRDLAQAEWRGEERAVSLCLVAGWSLYWRHSGEGDRPQSHG